MFRGTKDTRNAELIFVGPIGVKGKGGGSKLPKNSGT